jgi:hypothetical protein
LAQQIILMKKSILVWARAAEKVMRFLIFSFGSLIFTACSHHYYIPAQQSLHLFEEKGEIRAGGSIGESGYADFSSGNIAYALTEEIALAADYVYASGSGDAGSASGYMVDLSAGYYTTFGSGFHVDVFTGIGYSGQRHRYNETYTTIDEYGHSTQYNLSTRSDLNFIKLNVVPSIGFRCNWLDFGLSSKVSYIDFTKTNFYGSTPTGQPTTNQNRVLNLNYGLFFEPTATLRLGWKYVKIQSQFSFCLQMGGNSVNNSDSMISIGLQLNLKTRKGMK